MPPDKRDRDGDVTIVATNLAINPLASDVWVQVYRWEDGAPQGGVRGPLIVTGATTFRPPPRR